MKKHVLKFCAAALLAACGGGDSKPDARPTPDANLTPDAPTDNCTAATPGAFVFAGAVTGYASWSNELPTDVGGGGSSLLYALFYHTETRTSLVGTWDLAAGDEANYATCATCFVGVALDADGNPLKYYYQSGGSINVTTDPVDTATNRLQAMVTDLAMVEVTIDSNTFTSTPVANGQCLRVGSFALDVDNIPVEWTCTDAQYNDGATCDCACGAVDPDCDIEAAPIVGCNGDDLCLSGVCTERCNVLAPQDACTAGSCGFWDAMTDACFTDPADVDVSPIGTACAAESSTYCAAAGGIAAGICDYYTDASEAMPGICREACDSNDDCAAHERCLPLLAESNKGICDPLPAAWTCTVAQYEDGQTCDCECGAPDPDCGNSELPTPACGAGNLCVVADCQPLAANETCATAVAITSGMTVEGHNIQAANNVDIDNNSCTGYSVNGGDVMYAISLTAGQTVTATVTPLSTSNDPAILILGPGLDACTAVPPTCVAGADAGFSGDAETVSFAVTAAGTYYIVVDAFFEGGGAFTLSANVQ